MAMGLLKFANDFKWRGRGPGACSRWLRSLSLTQHLLLLALTPLPFLLVALLISHAVEQKPAQEPGRMARGVAAVRLLATVIEAGVYFERPQQLEQVVEALGSAENVAAMAIYDHTGRPLIERGAKGIATREQVRSVRKAGFVEERSGRMSFAAPVMSLPASRGEGLGDAMFTVTEPQAAGWVVLEFNNSLPGGAEDNLMLHQGLLTVAALAGSVYLALHLAHLWGDPMQRINDAVKRVRTGQLDVQVPVDAAGREMRQLQEGVSALVGVVEETRRWVQDGIDDVTEGFAYQAMHDHLTGLLNRRAFDRALDDAVTGSRRMSDRCVLCLIDLDHFKKVNDVGGHAAGDALLREVAKLLQQGVRAGDLTSRIGGDEFALLLSNCSTEDAQRIAGNLCKAIAGLRFRWEGRVFQVSASFGLAEIDASVDSCATALKIADEACYAAKREGRNQVVLHVGGRLLRQA